jgi:hypothetical protein
LAKYLAVIYALIGEKDLAPANRGNLANLSTLSYGSLKLHLLGRCAATRFENQ